MMGLSNDRELIM